MYFIKKEENDEIRKKLKERYLTTNTLPGTRSFHHFTPSLSNIVAAKRVSSDDDYAIKFDLILNRCITEDTEHVNVKASDLTVCFYDDLLWICLPDVIDSEEHDAKCNFMHPHYPANSFHWPHREDSCYVPLNNILCVIDAP